MCRCACGHIFVSLRSVHILISMFPACIDQGPITTTPTWCLLSRCKKQIEGWKKETKWEANTLHRMRKYISETHGSNAFYMSDSLFFFFYQNVAIDVLCRSQIRNERRGGYRFLHKGDRRWYRSADVRMMVNDSGYFLLIATREQKLSLIKAETFLFTTLICKIIKTRTLVGCDLNKGLWWQSNIRKKQLAWGIKKCWNLASNVAFSSQNTFPFTSCICLQTVSE